MSDATEESIRRGMAAIAATGYTTAEVVASTEESKRSGVLKSLADWGVSASDIGKVAAVDSPDRPRD